MSRKTKESYDMLFNPLKFDITKIYFVVLTIMFYNFNPMYLTYTLVDLMLIYHVKMIKYFSQRKNQTCRIFLIWLFVKNYLVSKRRILIKADSTGVLLSYNLNSWCKCNLTSYFNRYFFHATTSVADYVRSGIFTRLSILSINLCLI